LPRKVSGFMLRMLDAVSRVLPGISDVIIVRCMPGQRV
jgi:hypothetical protein